MAIDKFYFELAEAARWLWTNRNKPQYWEWTDLTSKNSDPTNLGLDDSVAWNIFTVLESKGLMHRLPHKKDGKEIHAFIIDLSDPKKWRDIRRDPTLYRQVCDWLKRFFIKFGKFILWVVSLIITTALTHGLTKWIDGKYP